MRRGKLFAGRTHAASSGPVSRLLPEPTERSGLAYASPFGPPTFGWICALLPTPSSGPRPLHLRWLV
jgi:hypothetical protein